MSRPAGSSETVLMSLWRQCVLAEWGNSCQLEGFEIECSGVVQCHHIKRRGIAPLRYSPTNGIPLCLAHHSKIGLRFYRNRLEEIVGIDNMEWLDAMERKLMPDYLREEGLTRWEWYKHQKEYLTGFLEIYREAKGLT